jgi:hypothetical protein
MSIASPSGLVNLKAIFAVIPKLHSMRSKSDWLDERRRI